jgi:hypothetical protein
MWIPSLSWAPQLRDLTDSASGRGSFASVPELVAAIDEAMACSSRGSQGAHLGIGYPSGLMDLRLRNLEQLDARAVPLPHGTEVVTRVARIVGERRVPQGSVGRPMVPLGAEARHRVGRSSQRGLLRGFDRGRHP